MKPTLETRLAHAGFDDHRLRGRSTLNELVGKGSFLQIAIFAITGFWVEGKDERLLDELATILVVADPRIWPDKVVRMVAAYGSVPFAYASGQLLQEGAWIGFRTGSRAAATLTALGKTLGETPTRAEIESALTNLLRDSRSQAGFGVPFRDVDERLERLCRSVEAHDCAERRWWRLLRQILASERGALPPPNIALGAAALLMDIGFGPTGIDDVTFLLGQTNLRANASEGVEQMPQVLRRLPDEWIEDRCKKPRLSPRAEAAAEGEGGPIAQT